MKTILIVEDEKALSEALSMYLDEYEIIVADNGADGLELAMKKQPDLMLLDQLMPVMNGTEVLEQMRSHEWGKNIDVIMMTNLNDIKTMNESLSSGVSDYIVKSEANLAEIKKLVDTRLKH